MNDLSRKTSKSLIENAFDFFETSIDNFQRFNSSDKENAKELKLCIVHFAIAFEILLKARICHEHWSLIVRNVKNPPHQEKFKQGNCSTISLDDCEKICKDTLNEPISSSALTDIRKIRNKVIHFHLDISNALLHEILSNQIQAYACFFQLIDKYPPWKEILQGYGERLNTIFSQLKEHYGFIHELAKDKLESEKKKIGGQQPDVTFGKCPNCGDHYGDLLLTSDDYKYEICDGKALAIGARCLLCSYHEDCTQIEYNGTVFSYHDQHYHIADGGYAYDCSCHHSLDAYEADNGDTLFYCDNCDAIHLEDEMGFCENCTCYYPQDFITNSFWQACYSTVCEDCSDSQNEWADRQ